MVSGDGWGVRGPGVTLVTLERGDLGVTMRRGTGRKQLKPWLHRTCLPAPASLASQGSLLEMQSLGPQACGADLGSCIFNAVWPWPQRTPLWSPKWASCAACEASCCQPRAQLSPPGSRGSSTPHRTPHPGTVSCAGGASRQGNGPPSPSSSPPGIATVCEAGALHCSPQCFLAPLGVKFQAFRLLGPLVAELLLGNTFWYFPLGAPRCESGVFYRWVQIHSLPRAPSPHPSRSGLCPPGCPPASTLPWMGQENHEAQVCKEDLEKEEASGHLLSLALGSACRWSAPTGNLPSCGGNSWNSHKFCEPPFPEV